MKVFSCAQSTSQGNDFELILTVKMKIKHPVRKPFVREYSAFVIIAALWRPLSRKSWKDLKQFLFFGKTTPYGKIFKNTVPKVFTASPIYVVVLKCRNIFPTWNWWNRALFTGQKIRLPLKLSLLHGSRPNPARASFQHLAHNVPNFTQIGSLWRSYSQTHEGRFFRP